MFLVGLKYSLVKAKSLRYVQIHKLPSSHIYLGNLNRLPVTDLCNLLIRVKVPEVKLRGRLFKSSYAKSAAESISWGFQEGKNQN